MTRLTDTFGYTGRHSEAIERMVRDTGAPLVDSGFSPRSHSPQRSGAARARQRGEDDLHLPSLGTWNDKDGGPVELADPEMVVQRHPTEWYPSVRRMEPPHERYDGPSCQAAIDGRAWRQITIAALRTAP